MAFTSPQIAQCPILLEHLQAVQLIGQTIYERGLSEAWTT